MPNNVHCPTCGASAYLKVNGDRRASEYICTENPDHISFFCKEDYEKMSGHIEEILINKHPVML